MEDQTQIMEEDHQDQLRTQATSFSEEKKIQEEKITELKAELEELKEDLVTAQSERDHVFTQAEGAAIGVTANLSTFF